MGELAPPEPSEPNPSESSDATASDATASDATASDDTASDHISKEQEGSPVHLDDLLEARDSPQRSPQRDDEGPRPPRVDYTCYKETGMRRDQVESSSSRSNDIECTVLRELTSLRSQFERHIDYIARMMHDMWEQAQDLREAIGFPHSAPPMPHASSERSPQEPPCPPTYTDMPTSAGTTAPSSAIVERLTPHTGATEEDPTTAGEATPASVVRSTTEDDTSCCREDHPPTQEDPASTTEGDTSAPAEVSASAFPDVDEAAGRPMPLTGAIKDYTPAEEDPVSTTEGDTTAPSTVFADADEAARRPAPLTGVTKDHAPTTKDPATTAEGAPTSVVVATTEGDTTAVAEVSSTIVVDTDDPIATVDLAASTIDDD
ncbi:hypothetical protein E2562_019676 [Oryza meyeriana var. granulata]|uniref:Uncharacterized protein n=1 Tax=Oryza meyeriana var. granulata TaxID=110450 RepID=A0A6G1C868_9ORYZ|nr:hypothetical protein E2562_019676 [Oryza meyeriana var. granulata]